MTAEPEKTHVSKEYTHKSPLIACRFDAHGAMSLPAQKTIRSDAGNLPPARKLPLPATRAGFSPLRPIPPEIPS